MSLRFRRVLHKWDGIVKQKSKEQYHRVFFITIRYVKNFSYVMWSCEIIKIKKQKTYFPWTFINTFKGKNLVFSDIDLQLKSCLWCLKTSLVCHNESNYTLLHLLHKAAPSTGKVVWLGRLRLLWLWLKLVVEAISCTIKKSHCTLSFYWFFFYIKKNR